MNNENHFTPRLLAAAVRVKNAIDLKFNTITTAPLQPIIKNPLEPNNHKWKNAELFAAEFNVNRKELQCAFKYCNSRGIGEYQAERKIEAACILLSKGEMTIKEIAVELEYHQDYFSFLFKKQKGMAPTEWQKRLLAPIENNSPKI
jgi:AraC-like DNA-binding protein